MPEAITQTPAVMPLTHSVLPRANSGYYWVSSNPEIIVVMSLHIVVSAVDNHTIEHFFYHPPDESEH